MDNLDSSSCSDGWNSTLACPHREFCKDLSEVLWALEMPDNPLSCIGELTTESLLEHSGYSSVEEVTILNLSNTSLSIFMSSPDIDNTLFLSLEFLDLSNNNLKEVPAIKLCLSLKELRISNNLIEDLAFISLLKSLHTLIAASNKIKSIGNIDSLCVLHTIDLSDNQLFDFQETFAALRGLKTLRILNVDKNAFFLKTPKAFDIFAYVFALEILNGVDLKKFSPRVNSKTLAKIKGLIRKADLAPLKSQDGIKDRLRSVRSSRILHQSVISNSGQVSSPI